MTNKINKLDAHIITNEFGCDGIAITVYNDKPDINNGSNVSDAKFKKFICDKIDEIIDYINQDDEEK